MTDNISGHTCMLPNNNLNLFIPEQTLLVFCVLGLPDWTWVQCDNCLKWRRLPDGVESQNLPDKWFCYSNPDPVHR